MAISSHEMYLILKVRDEGSRMLRAFGSEFSNVSAKTLQAAQKQLMAGAALTTLGVAIGAAGVAGLMFFNDAINASIKYTEQAALTLTQVDKLGVSLEDVKNIGRRVANEVPTAFESIQKGLYDIFSSMDVTVPQAEMLLRNLSKAAVSGAVDVSTVARATIGILNAYKLPASDVTKVNDVMFQLVRKGIGTYEEFTTTIGRSIPSAVKAGQTYQSVAGMLAFLTRNNMSAAMSSSAAARAMDAISKPKSIENLQKMGIAVADSSGKFRPMVSIMDDLRAKLSGLTPVAKAIKLNDIFKGSGGTIQAMRFFNLATSKSGPLLDDMTKAMNNAGGAAAAAYAIMSNTPQAKLQLLNNRYQVMKTIVGDQLLPVKLKLIEALGKLLSWWNKLDPSVQRNIVYTLAIGAALAVLTGIVLIGVGVLLMLGAAAAMAGIGMLTVVGVIAVVVAALAALAFGVYWTISHWDEIKRELIVTWHAILDFLSTTWDTIKNNAIAWLTGIKSWFSSTWDAIKSKVVSVWDGIIGAIATAINWVKGIVQFELNGLKAIWAAVWGFFGPMVRATWGLIVAIVNLGIAAVNFVILWTLRGLSIAWEFIWGNISRFVIGIWNGIFAFVAPKVTAIRDWIVSAWNSISSSTSSSWNGIYSWIASRATAIWQWIQNAWNTVRNLTSGAWNSLSGIISGAINSAMGWVAGIQSRVQGYLSGAGNWLYQAGKNIIQGLANGITAAIGSVTAAITNVTSWITSHLPHSPVQRGPLRVLNNGYVGKQIIRMIANGMNDLGPITKAMDNLGSVIVTPTFAPASMGGFDDYRGRPGSGGSGGSGGASQIINMKNYIRTQEINPEKHAADLGWAFASKVRP